MPKSKRQKIVTLTKTASKGRLGKEKLVTEIRQALDDFTHIYVYSVDNNRNSFLKKAREDWKAKGRFFFGRDKVMALALGTKSENEQRPGLASISSLLKGEKGLFFTSAPLEEVTSYFGNFVELDYARAGSVASATVTMPAGGLYNTSNEAIAPSVYEMLLKLGVPVIKEKGVLVLPQEFNVCTVGQALTPNQAQILKLLGHRLSEFKIHLSTFWSRLDGKCQAL